MKEEEECLECLEGDNILTDLQYIPWTSPGPNQNLHDTIWQMDSQIDWYGRQMDKQTYIIIVVILSKENQIHHKLSFIMFLE